MCCIPTSFLHLNDFFHLVFIYEFLTQCINKDYVPTYTVLRTLCDRGLILAVSSLWEPRSPWWWWWVWWIVWGMLGKNYLIRRAPARRVESRLLQTANVRSKLTTNQIRKWGDKNWIILMDETGMKWLFFVGIKQRVKQVKKNLMCHKLTFTVLLNLSCELRLGLKTTVIVHYYPEALKYQMKNFVTKWHTEECLQVF